jgi:predicted enzyme related to lactoylglutathione lyase
MPEPSLTILYVESATASAAFYEGLLGRPPAEASPGFAMFPLASGGALGLWTRAGVVPAATGTGGSELCLQAEDVDAVHADWSARGLRIAMPPTDLDFGRSFVALDPDGHRLRVMCAG